MESLGIMVGSQQSSFWYGKKVFLAGHAGFKGGWLSLWLQSLGAQVYGYVLNPPTIPNFFTIAVAGLLRFGTTRDGVEIRKSSEWINSGGG